MAGVPWLLAATRPGVLGIGGTIALAIGSVMAMREVPGVRVSLGTIIPAALVLAGGVLALGRLALKAQRHPPQTGVEGMIGETGRSRTALAPERRGQVDAHGEIWNAVSREALPPGTPVRIVGVDGLTLLVEADGRSDAEGANVWKA